MIIKDKIWRHYDEISCAKGTSHNNTSRKIRNWAFAGKDGSYRLPLRARLSCKPFGDFVVGIFLLREGKRCGVKAFPYQGRI